MNVGEEEKISIQEYLDVYNAELPEFGEACKGTVDTQKGSMVAIRAQNCDDVWSTVQKWPKKMYKKLNSKLYEIIELDRKLFTWDPFTKKWSCKDNELKILRELYDVYNAFGLDMHTNYTIPELEDEKNIERAVQVFNTKHINRKEIKQCLDPCQFNFNSIVRRMRSVLEVLGFCPWTNENVAKNLLLLLPSSKDFFKECQKTKMSLEEILKADDLFDFLDDEKFKDFEAVFAFAEYEKFEVVINNNTFIDDEIKKRNMIKMDKIGDSLLEHKDVLNNLENAKKALQFYYKRLPGLIEKEGVQVTPKLSFAYKLLEKYDRLGNEDNFKALKECVRQHTKDILKTEEIENEIDQIGDSLLERKDVLNNLKDAKKALEFYYKSFPELINNVTNVANKDKISIDEGHVQVTPKLSFAYELLKKYDRPGNEDNFKALKKCVAECTKNILETAEIKQTMSDISTFIEKCDNSNPNDILNMISNDMNSESIIKNINKALQFLHNNQIIDNDPFDMEFNTFSDINVDKWDAFCEAVSFFFKNFFSDFTLWKNCAKASDRLKTSRFINQFRNESVSLNGCDEGIEQQSSVFDLLKDIPMLCPKTKNNDKQKLDLQ